MSEVSEKLAEQYQEIADVIESEGLDYAITNGYISSNTDDEELNEAVKKAEEGLRTIERIIKPYAY